MLNEAKDPPPPELREALEGLDLPAHTIERWLDDDIAFCRRHGGERVYGELLAILGRFRHANAGAGAPPTGSGNESPSR